MCVSPVFVDEVHAERVGWQLHQAVHGHIHVAVTGRLAGTQSQTVIHQTAGIPATNTHNTHNTHTQKQRERERDRNRQRERETVINILLVKRLIHHLIF